MSQPSSFEPPAVIDKDIDWVGSLLNLPTGAFGGYHAEARRQVLKSMESIDVAACPGSGKTTILVAKLAILADKWAYRTQGICALSHTNVARKEIEIRLCGTTIGRRLLSYPHYIGTIHGFVNQFLALPWLRSQGYPIKFIDSDLCEKRRWAKLPQKTRMYLQNQNIEPFAVRIVDSNFNVTKKSGTFTFGTDTPTYNKLTEACKQAALEGYHCFDDMFVWGNDMINRVPTIIDVIRARFPLLFVDEAQDNSEEQSKILQRVFCHGQTAVVRQRLGDANQAIFDSTSTGEATTNRFPDESIKRELPDSHRFGQKIADLARPLGLAPHDLKGLGPRETHFTAGNLEGRHTVFLFDDDRATKVLDAFGDLLLNTFSAAGLQQGTFVAVGLVHMQQPFSGPKKFPHCVGDYWPEYRPDLTRKEPRPRTFPEYVELGTSSAIAAGEAHLCVQKIAEATLHLGKILDPKKVPRRSLHQHDFVLNLLENTAMREQYKDLVHSFAINGEVLTIESWKSKWRPLVTGIAKWIAGTQSSNSEADAFLEWRSASPAPGPSPTGHKNANDNVYRYSSGAGQVPIRIGSIHSVKGETHTATLVLETYWYKHNLLDVLPWLNGQKSGRTGANDRQVSRLKAHYVAMTRPTHLMCLAMKRSCFVDHTNSLDSSAISKMTARGWEIKTV